MRKNPYLTERISGVFSKVAIPTVFFMTFHGLTAVVDAYFLGAYIGTDALAAVALTFPIQTFLFAISNLFSKGMASLVARKLGENDLPRASEIFVSAYIVLIVVFLGMSVIYWIAGKSLIAFIIGDAETLIVLCDQYVRVLVFFSPVIGLMILNNDALRSEGRLRFMSGVMLGSTFINVFLDYLFIAKLGWGVEASAYATIIGYGTALSAVLIYRYCGYAYLSPIFGGWSSFWRDVVNIVSLGLPNSLTLIGMAFLVAAINYNLKVWSGNTYMDAVAAYGVVSRLMTFVMFPMVGMTIAFQSILGNNYGAGEYGRAKETIKFCIRSVFIYCTIVQTVFWGISYASVGSMFVDDPMVKEQISVMLRYVSAAFFTVGPVAILAAMFQSLGDARSAMVLGPSKIFLFSIPLIFILPFFIGRRGILLAIPIADFMFFLLAFVVLKRNTRYSNVTNWVNLGRISNSGA